MTNLSLFFRLATVALFLFLAYKLFSILLIFFVGFILAVTLKPIITLLNSKTRLPEPAIVLILYGLLLTLAILSLIWMLPSASRELSGLIKQFTTVTGFQPNSADLLIVQDVEAFTNRLQLIDQTVRRYGGTFTGALSVIQVAFSTIFIFFTVLVTAYYFLLIHTRIPSYLAWIFPGPQTEKQLRAKRMFNQIQLELGGWVRGRLLVMLIIGISTYVTLSILGIPYALTLAIIACLLEIIPHFGPIISAIPAILIATFMINPIMGLTVMCFYILIQQIESNFLTPQVMKHEVNIPPLASIFLVLSGAHLIGIVGGVLSLPIFLVARALVKELKPEIKSWWG